MKKWIASMMIGALLSTSMPVFAETPALPTPALTVGEADVGEAISPLKKGQTAPFTGVLLSPRASARMTVEMKNVEEKIKIAVERMKEESDARCSAKVTEEKIKADANSKVLQAQLEAAGKQNSILNQRLEKEEKDRPNVMLWTALGAGGGVAVTILIVIVTSGAQK